jgi:hypothetical protein
MRNIISFLFILILAVGGFAFGSANTSPPGKADASVHLFADESTPVVQLGAVQTNREVERQSENQSNAPPVALPPSATKLALARAGYTDEPGEIYRKVPDKNINPVLPVSLALPRMPPEIVSRN